MELDTRDENLKFVGLRESAATDRGGRRRCCRGGNSPSNREGVGEEREREREIIYR